MGLRDKSQPRNLLTHGWLRDNLGDFLITYEFVRRLRKKFPEWCFVHETVKRSLRFPELDLIEQCFDEVRDCRFEKLRFGRLKAFDCVVNCPSGGLQNPGDRRHNNSGNANVHGVPYIPR